MDRMIFVNDDTCQSIEKESSIKLLIKEIQGHVISWYIFLGDGTLKLLVNRKIPDYHNSRLMIIYNAIREHPGIT